MVDFSKAHYYSPYPVDKVLFISDRLSATTPAAEPAIAGAFSDTFSHNGGPDVVVSGVFSIDAVNYYPFGAYIVGETYPNGNELLTVDGYMDAPGSFIIRGITTYFDPQTVYIYIYLESIS